MPPDDTFVHILPFYTAGDLYHGLLQCRTSHSFVQIWVLTISYKFYLCSTGRGAKYDEKQKKCRNSQCINGANNIHGTACSIWVGFHIQYSIHPMTTMHTISPCVRYCRASSQYASTIFMLSDIGGLLLTMGMVVGHKQLVQYLVGFHQVQVQRIGFTRL